jgi:hypothetical protein
VRIADGDWDSMPRGESFDLVGITATTRVDRSHELHEMTRKWGPYFLPSTHIRSCPFLFVQFVQFVATISSLLDVRNDCRSRPHAEARRPRLLCFLHPRHYNGSTGGAGDMAFVQPPGHFLRLTVPSRRCLFALFVNGPSGGSLAPFSFIFIPRP